MGLKEILIGIVTWIILTLILILPLTFLFIWKVCVILVAKCIRKDLRLVCGLDIMNAFGEVINFGLVCKIEGQIGVEDMQKLFSQKFLASEESNPSQLLYERLHCSLVTFGGFSFFQKISHTNVEESIYVKNLNDNEGQTLEDLISKWILTKYKTNSPCWEIMLVPLRAINQTALAMKIHHAFADGYSVLYILDKLTQNTSPYLVKDFTDSCGKQVCMTRNGFDENCMTKNAFLN